MAVRGVTEISVLATMVASTGAVACSAFSAPSDVAGDVDRR
jgi:hypothetical protein